MNKEMSKLTEDGNHTEIQQLLCIQEFHGTHRNIFLSALNSTLSITAFLGNILIIVALRKVSSLHPPSKLLLGCLASTDLCVGLIAQPLYVNYLLSPKRSKHCFFSAIVSNTIAILFCGVSLLTLTAISVDRLLALLSGLRYRHVVTLRKVWVFVVSFWLSSTALAITLLFIYRIAIYIMCVLMLLCIVTTTVSYRKIYLKLRHHQAQVQDHVHQAQPADGTIPLNIARYRKTVSTALWFQITLLACYLPYCIVVILPITGLDTPFIDLVWSVTASLVFLNSTLNPFLYCWKIREVRQAVKRTIKQFICSL
ncbi:melanocyte-stimulating hormone receptor-like [Oculina patagonica]